MYSIWSQSLVCAVFFAGICDILLMYNTTFFNINVLYILFILLFRIVGV